MPTKEWLERRWKIKLGCEEALGGERVWRWDGEEKGSVLFVLLFIFNAV